MKETGDVKRAEDYIASMLGVVVSTVSIMATVSVMILSIIANLKPSASIILITICVLLSVLIFIYCFYLGMKSYGTLVLAVKEGIGGFEKTTDPARKLTRLLTLGLIIFGISCCIFLFHILYSYLN
jgi:hypothetical protein